jgi:hypothetical protein
MGSMKPTDLGDLILGITMPQSDASDRVGRLGDAQEALTTASQKAY